MVFLTFLLYGGDKAVLVAVFEMAASCIYLKSRGSDFRRFTIIFNIGSVAVTTQITNLVWSSWLSSFDPRAGGIETTQLIVSVGVLAITQFVGSSLLASAFYAINTKTNFFVAWKTNGVTVSMTHFLGGGLAAIVFKLLNYADFVSIFISLVILAVVYFAYRHIIAEMTRSIEQAEQAERATADAERQKRIEVEKYAEDLALALKKEEDAGRALRRSRRAFQHAALHDPLTKLPNRAYFGEMLRNLIESNTKSGQSRGFVLFLDIARFKTINDSLGHTIGDKVLVLISKRFQRMVPSSALVARLGGDEFAIILKDCERPQDAEQVAWSIHQKLAQSFAVSGNKINILLNIGIAPCGPSYETPDDILRDADIAMHYAKEKSSGVELFSPIMRERFVRHAQIEAELPYAIERGELALHYQPLISLKDGSLIGFEALLRWFHRERGFISPAEFIPVAEETGQIIPITTWILKQTCAQLARWQKVSPAGRQLIMSVNISGKHLSYQSLLVDVEMALENARIAPSSLKLEITESAAMEDAEQTIRMLSHLKTLGVQLSIDDFGTGYSSLSYLHRLPVDTLKIDRSFVNAVGENGEDSEILQTIISLAKNLKLRVIAEGIETESQLGFLRAIGCDYGQGYLMSKPLPPEMLDEPIVNKHNWLPAGADQFELAVTEITEEKNLPSF